MWILQKRTCSPLPSVTEAQCDLAMALIFTVLLQHHYIQTHIYKLLHYRKLKIQVSTTVGLVPDLFFGPHQKAGQVPE